MADDSAAFREPLPGYIECEASNGPEGTDVMTFVFGFTGLGYVVGAFLVVLLGTSGLISKTDPKPGVVWLNVSILMIGLVGLVIIAKGRTATISINASAVVARTFLRRRTYELATLDHAEVFEEVAPAGIRWRQPLLVNRDGDRVRLRSFQDSTEGGVTDQAVAAINEQLQSGRGISPE